MFKKIIFVSPVRADITGTLSKVKIRLVKYEDYEEILPSRFGVAVPKIDYAP